MGKGTPSRKNYWNIWKLFFTCELVWRKWPLLTKPSTFDPIVLFIIGNLCIRLTVAVSFLNLATFSAKTFVVVVLGLMGTNKQKTLAPQVGKKLCWYLIRPPRLSARLIVTWDLQAKILSKKPCANLSYRTSYSNTATCATAYCTATIELQQLHCNFFLICWFHTTSVDSIAVS